MAAPIIRRVCTTMAIAITASHVLVVSMLVGIGRLRARRSDDARRFLHVLDVARTGVVGLALRRTRRGPVAHADADERAAGREAEAAEDDAGERFPTEEERLGAGRKVVRARKPDLGDGDRADD